MKLRTVRRADDGGEDINLAPLIDMTFLLLIFFMVTTTFTSDAEMRIDRPGAASGTPSVEGTVRVAVTASGTVLVQDRVVEVYMLQSTLEPLLRPLNDPRVIVVSDQSVTADRLIDVVDQCRLAGAAHVAVAVEEDGHGG
jgi:biopolymer transport protein ExbD